eukprot:14254810-Heterocapsa_arctica.AAC.1
MIYNKLAIAVRKQVDEARLKEWTGYLKFGAVKIISSKKDIGLVMSTNAEELPTQRIDSDKHGFLRMQGDTKTESKKKGRLVARGNLSAPYDRSVPPTADKEAMLMVLNLDSAELEHGYFQRKKLSRPLQLRQPRDVLTNPNIKTDDRMLALVPIYGTNSAGRGLWRGVRRVMMNSGSCDNMIVNPLYSHTSRSEFFKSKKHTIICWRDEVVEDTFEAIKKELIFGIKEETEFKFYDMKNKQADDLIINVACEMTSERHGPILLSRERVKQTEQPITPDEHEAFRTQGTKIVFIADASAVCNDEAQVHMVSFSSTVIKRVVHSTIKDETYQLTDVVEGADLIRAALTDARDAVEERQWQTTAAAWTTSLWFTDCR